MQASVQLKNEGNQLHAQSKFHEAIAKYERAHSNVIDMVGKEASDLRKACTLNLSSCFLNTQQWGKCVELCDEVLTGEAACSCKWGWALKRIRPCTHACACMNTNLCTARSLCTHAFFDPDCFRMHPCSGRR